MAGTVVEQFQLLEERRDDPPAKLFKAHDARMNRSVWVEVFPGGLTPEHTEAKLRFIEEAFMASAVESPYILPAMAFLNEGLNEWVVFEYLRARTLDRWLAHQKLSRESTLRHCVQVCEALDAANRAGLAHGDVRPGSVMIPASGPCRLYNFGFHNIRRLQAELAGQRPAASMYDAPERRAGGPPTLAADIYSYGCVVYEAFSGRPAFAQPGDNLIPLDAAAPDAPPSIAEMVARCLATDPADRYAGFGEVRRMLERARDPRDVARPRQAAAVEPAAIPAPAAAEVSRESAGDDGEHSQRHRHHRRHHRNRGTPARPSGRWGRLLWGCFVGAAVLGGISFLGYSLGWFHDRSEAGAMARELTHDPGWTMDPSISIDGSTVAYASDRAGQGNLDIYVQDPKSGKTKRLTSDATDDIEPSISPDGRFVVFRSEREGGGLYIVPTDGKGSARLLAPDGRKPRISPRGDMVAYWSLAPETGQGRGFVIPLSGGTVTPLAPEFASVEAPIWSPDGSQLMFVGREHASDAPELFATAAWGGSPIATGLFRSFLSSEFRPTRPECWRPLPDRLVVTGSSRDIARINQVNFNRRDWSVSLPKQISPGIDTEAAPAISGSGLMVFARATMRVGLWKLGFNHDEMRYATPPVRITNPGLVVAEPAISKDGRHLVMLDNRTGKYDVWSREIKSGNEIPLTILPTRPQHPVAAADRVVFGTVESSGPVLYQVPLGGGPMQRVCGGCGPEVWDISRDGRTILHSSTTDAHTSVSVRELSGNTSSVVLESGEQDVLQASWSPNERWMAFVVRLPLGKTRVYVTAYRGARPHPRSEWIAITAGDEWDSRVHWSPDGDALYFYSLRDTYRCIWAARVNRENGRPVGLPFGVYHSHSVRTSLRNVAASEQELAVAGDGLVFTQGEFQGNLWILDLNEAEKESSR
jgi:eukaryotic-like serine/threonine-protein kinase